MSSWALPLSSATMLLRAVLLLLPPLPLPPLLPLPSLGTAMLTSSTRRWRMDVRSMAPLASSRLHDGASVMKPASARLWARDSRRKAGEGTTPLPIALMIPPQALN